MHFLKKVKKKPLDEIEFLNFNCMLKLYLKTLNHEIVFPAP